MHSLRLFTLFAFVAFSLPGLLCVAASDEANRGFSQGILVEQTPSEFAVVTRSHLRLRFSFDSKTWIERENGRIRGDQLRIGETVEVVSDRLKPGEIAVYARLIHVLRPEHSGIPSHPAAPTRTTEIRMTGIVSALHGDSLTLRTAFDGMKIIRLRSDTEFLANGDHASASDLRTNLRVFVRGTRDLSNRSEAYQVVWGAILWPPPIGEN